MEIASLVKEYLSVILSRPIAILVIGMYFLIRFREPINSFLTRMKSIKYWGVEVWTSQTAEISKDTKMKQPKKYLKEIKEIRGKNDENKKLIDYLINESKFYKFAYLDLFLVWKSKKSLLWFYDTWSATKDNYIENFPEYFNKIDNSYFVEKKELEIIYNVLLSHELIELNMQQLISVTDSWKAFLKYIKYIS